MHCIEKRDCQVGLKQAWHGLTIIVPEITRENCGITYDMEAVPLYYEREKGVYEVSGSKQIISLDDRLPIGPAVNDTYTLITNKEVLDMVENSLTGTKHIIDSVGTVKNREIAFVSIKLDEAFRAAGRVTEARLNCLWGHSGKMALIAKTGFTQVVCFNTFTAALREHGDFKLSVKHTKNAKANIANLEKAIDRHFGVCKEFQLAMDEFANIKVTQTKAEELFAGALVTVDENGEVKELPKRSRNTVDRLSALFVKGAGNDGDDLSDVFGAWTDFYSHESSGGNNRWKQFESSEFGAGNKAKIEFFDILRSKKLRDETAKRGAVALTF